MIQFENVTKRFRDTGQTALSQVSFRILPGQMAFLRGENGSGKTTLMRLLMRELTADEGAVRVNGQDIGRLKKDGVWLYRRKIGMIFQDFRLVEDWTVYENVALVKRVSGAGERDIRLQTARALRMVGMEAAFSRPVLELSGGERQRVCVARAIVGNPCCILADEPTGNLAPRQAREIMLLLEQLNGLGITMLVATHDAEAIAGMEHRQLYLRNGKLDGGE